jgi:glutamate dehydrogenase (NAD(P)+)
VDEVKEVIPLISEVLDLRHPQEGIVRGHLQADDDTCRRILGQLKEGVELKTTLPEIPGHVFALADLITGRGVQAAATAYFEQIGDTLQGKRVLIEGFGAVGGPAAYYFEKAGAKVVGIVSMGSEGRQRWCVDPAGLDTAALLRDRDHGRLPAGSQEGAGDDSSFWQTPADVFVPAAASYTLTEPKLDRLRQAGVHTLVCGANTPFADREPGVVKVQKIADQTFAVVPDFIANCGMARAFAYLMIDGADLHYEALDADIEACIRKGVKDLLEGGGEVRKGLLERAFRRFIR